MDMNQAAIEGADVGIAAVARDMRRDPGGKGINVSHPIRWLGGETTAFGVAGGCAGYMLRSLMAEKGLRFEAVELPEESRINVILTNRRSICALLLT